MILFYILLMLFVGLLIMQIVGIILYQKQKRNSPILAVACAGSEKCNTPKAFRITNLSGQVFKDKEGYDIKVQDYVRCITVGNSMLLGGIKDRDIIFIKKDINVAECEFPVILVLQREPAAMEKALSLYNDKAELKIRRTWRICSLNLSDEEILSQVKDIIESPKFGQIRQIDETKFADTQWMIEDIKARITRYRTEHIGCENVGNKDSVALLSTTYDTIQERVHFSIHSIKNVIGEVKYAFGSNN